MAEVLAVVGIIAAVSIGGGLYYWRKRGEAWEAVIESVDAYQQKRGYGETAGLRTSRYRISYRRTDGRRGVYDLAGMAFAAAGQALPCAGDRIVKRAGEAGPVILPAESSSS